MSCAIEERYSKKVAISACFSTLLACRNKFEYARHLPAYTSEAEGGKETTN